MENIDFGTGLAKRANSKGKPVADGEYAIFGSYPTSLVKDRELIERLNALAGALPTEKDDRAWTAYEYYQGHGIYESAACDEKYMWYFDARDTDNTAYRGVYFAKYRPRITCFFADEAHSHQKENGYSVGVVYWFKYEPILWKIVKTDKDSVMLSSASVIDSMAYQCLFAAFFSGEYYILRNKLFTINEKGDYIRANDYKHSTVREWLNNSFYNTAFSPAEQEMIFTVEVDNSKESTGKNNASGFFENTDDAVFLLSKAEASECGRVFSRKTATDYAKCQGERVLPSGNSAWYLRSPEGTSGTYAQICGHNSEDCYSANWLCGICPALWVKL